MLASLSKHFHEILSKTNTKNMKSKDIVLIDEIRFNNVTYD
jgi:hypothetical protein